MPALNLPAVQGATLIAEVTVKNADKSLHDFTGATAQMMVRSTVLATGSPLFTLTSATNGGITLGGTTGLLTIEMTAAQTELFTTGYSSTYPPTSTWYYDLFETDTDGEVTQILSGKITVSAAVTHE